MTKKLSEIITEAKEAYEKGKKMREALMQSPQFREFVESGASAKVSILISMAYLVQTVGNGYFEEAIGIMEKHDMVHKKIKTTATNLSQSFDAFDKVISQLINTQEAKLQLCSDYEIFQKTCDHFMNADVRVDDVAGSVTDPQIKVDIMKKPKPNNVPRKVVAYTGDGIRIFDSVKDVAEHYGLHVQSVYALINNGKETADGVSFDYQKWED